MQEHTAGPCRPPRHLVSSPQSSFPASWPLTCTDACSYSSPRVRLCNCPSWTSQVPLHPTLQPVVLLLNGSTSFWCVSCSSQLCIMHVLTEGGLCLLIKGTDEDIEQDQTQHRPLGNTTSHRSPLHSAPSITTLWAWCLSFLSKEKKENNKITQVSCSYYYYYYLFVLIISHTDFPCGKKSSLLVSSVHDIQLHIWITVSILFPQPTFLFIVASAFLPLFSF